MGLEHFLVLSGVLFCIGLYGVLVRRNVITVLMSLEIMFTAVTLAAVAMSRYVQTMKLEANPAGFSDPTVAGTLLTGQVLALFIIVVAAAEIALGLGIVISLYRSRDTVDVSQANLMSK
ncbi:NADH-quinone oxidoreductase subunit NuoK [SAR202 cluster bacterium AD-804-J14_MRT_500m]|nr:NADH-quinone oxidoreductase subunit NuoK [SAR202 cluster bacterium AD-804-J14_MRT_500m]